MTLIIYRKRTRFVSQKSAVNGCFYHIRDLRRIRRFLSLSVAKTIATALVSSRLDYCNSLLYNTANKDIAKLQRIQNCLARVVTRSPRFSRSVPVVVALEVHPVRDDCVGGSRQRVVSVGGVQAIGRERRLLMHARRLRRGDDGRLSDPRVDLNHRGRLCRQPTAHVVKYRQQ